MWEWGRRVGRGLSLLPRRLKMAHESVARQGRGGKNQAAMIEAIFMLFQCLRVKGGWGDLMYITSLLPSSEHAIGELCTARRM